MRKLTYEQVGAAVHGLYWALPQDGCRALPGAGVPSRPCRLACGCMRAGRGLVLALELAALVPALPALLLAVTLLCSRCSAHAAPALLLTLLTLLLLLLLSLLATAAQGQAEGEAC